MVFSVRKQTLSFCANPVKLSKKCMAWSNILTNVTHVSYVEQKYPYNIWKPTLSGTIRRSFHLETRLDWDFKPKKLPILLKNLESKKLGQKCFHILLIICIKTKLLFLANYPSQSLQIFAYILLSYSYKLSLSL